MPVGHDEAWPDHEAGADMDAIAIDAADRARQLRHLRLTDERAAPLAEQRIVDVDRALHDSERRAFLDLHDRLDGHAIVRVEAFQRVFQG